MVHGSFFLDRIQQPVITGGCDLDATTRGLGGNVPAQDLLFIDRVLHLQWQVVVI